MSENYAIIYSSKTGNTKLLAEEVERALDPKMCMYAGAIDEKATIAVKDAARIYVGFWTDKGDCDSQMKAFLQSLHEKEIFLFGTAGFGGEETYFNQILGNVRKHLDDRNVVIGTFMCQGKMPLSVRERYEKMLEQPNPAFDVEKMIQNFDQALSHPSQSDLDTLKKAMEEMNKITI